MRRAELVKLKRLLQQETNRRNRINELLANNLIQEFLALNTLDIHELQTDNKWLILEELLKEFEITESNGILVCTGSYVVGCRVCYQETEYYTQEVSFDNKYIEYQMFKNIETSTIYKAYTDKHIQTLVDEETERYGRAKRTLSELCHSRYGRYLVSELMEKYTILNPYNSSKNDNGFKDVQKDFFMTSIEKGQSTAKKMILTKYPQMR